MQNVINRRQFHVITASSTLALAARSQASPQEAATQQIAFLSDTHISADVSTVAREVNMADHLEQVVGQVVDAMPNGSHVIVNGDCAYLKGLPGDYLTFAKLTKPITDAGLRLHVSMGNHDDRTPLYQALAAQKSNDIAVDDKHVDVIPLPNVDIVLLDSLWKVNKVTGQIGQSQLNWLKQYLDSDSQRSVLVAGHHNLQFNDSADGKPYSGVQDTNELTDLLHKHPRVKAYLYGHTHRWENRQLEGGNRSEAPIHLVNLPAVGYVFDQQQPSGWVQGNFTDDGLELTIKTLDRSHPKSDEMVLVSLA